VVLDAAITPADVERAREAIGNAAETEARPSAAAVLRAALAA
jgi:hypothetical protein